jgi:hypothetical protein
MTDDGANDDVSVSNVTLDETVAQFLRDVDAAHEDYERGYTDADATLSVVMSHVDRLRARATTAETDGDELTRRSGHGSDRRTRRTPGPCARAGD